MKLEDLPQSVKEWFENYDKPILLMVEKNAPNAWATYVQDDPKIVKETAKAYRWIWRKPIPIEREKQERRKGNQNMQSDHVKYPEEC